MPIPIRTPDVELSLEERRLVGRRARRRTRQAVDQTAAAVARRRRRQNPTPAQEREQRRQNRNRVGLLRRIVAGVSRAAARGLRGRRGRTQRG